MKNLDPGLCARFRRMNHNYFETVHFYDLQTDPIERHNLIDVPAYQEQIESLRNQLFTELAESGGLNLPIRIPEGERLDQRKRP